MSVAFPKAAVWQQLRSRALDCFPPGLQLAYSSPLSVSEWWKSGFYTVISHNATSFQLDVDALDLGAAVFSDAEWFLDHAAEHVVTVGCGDGWSSRSWDAVTVYYWAFFSGVALTRLLGESPCYVSRDALMGLVRMSPSVGSAPGAGAFSLELGAQSGASRRTAVLRKARGTVHESFWRSFFDMLAEYVRVSGGVLDADEHEVYGSLAESTRRLGKDWPTSLRNAINYRAGYSYRAVRGTDYLDSRAYLRRLAPADSMTLLARFRNELAAVPSGTPADASPRQAARLLALLAAILGVMTEQLRTEVVERRQLDRRWGAARDRFLANRGMRAGGVRWPLAT